MTFDPTQPWGRLCAVDPAPLAAWVTWGSARAPWVVQAGHKPARLHSGWPEGLVRSLAEAVLVAALALSDGHPLTYREVVLSRVPPGLVHPMHVDQRESAWWTRVHVPLITHAGAWHEFEEDYGERFTMLAGWAYWFDASRRHAFGNDGESDRVHLVLDVVRL